MDGKTAVTGDKVVRLCARPMWWHLFKQTGGSLAEKAPSSNDTVKLYLNVLNRQI